MKTIKEVQDFIDLKVNDDFVLRYYRLWSIIDRIAGFVGKDNLTEDIELEKTPYGDKYFGNISIRCTDGTLTYRLEQSGSNGVYATYID